MAEEICGHVSNERGCALNVGHKGDHTDGDETWPAAPTPVEPKVDVWRGSWAHPRPGTRRDIIGVHDLPDGRTEYLMHNEGLCRPYYLAVSAPPAAPQGVERAQPVEPKCPPCPGDPKGTGFCEFHECERDCQTVEPYPAAQPVEGPRETCKWCKRPIEKDGQFWRHLGESVTPALEYSCDATGDYLEVEPAPVEGVERVTDDAEPLCATCGDSGKIQIREGESGPFIGEAPCPAKHADDRPAETIPRDLKSYYHCKHFAIFTDVMEDWDFCNSLSLDSLIERTGRAETRIEVLEAALRDAWNGLGATLAWDTGSVVKEDWPSVISLVVKAAESVRAALAAPSGEQKGKS